MHARHTARRWHADGLVLQARDYPPCSAAERTPVVCLHGLTRNAADFEQLAQRLAARGHRVIVPDIRGRGRSARDPQPMRYLPATYAADVAGLLDALGIVRAVFIGTSMGGIVTLELMMHRPALIAAAVLNDVGPEVSPVGLARIAAYAGQPAVIDSWADACDYVRRINQAAFPQFGEAQWEAFARRTFREDASGKPQLDYDPAIAEPIKAGLLKADPERAWRLFGRLCRERPVLLLRGTLSDIVSADIAARMQAYAPTLRRAEIPHVGHAPLLDEPAACVAIDDYLEHVEHDA